MSKTEHPVSKSLCGDFPDWKSVAISLTPLIIRSIFSKPIRSFLLRKMGDFTRKYMAFWTSPSAEEKKIRKTLVKHHNLTVMSQKQYDQLNIKNGMRCCPPGFDYSSVIPGDTPCCFYKNDSNDVAFLGHHKVWPDRSIFEGGSILGRGSNTGKHSTLVGCRLLSECIIDTNTVVESCSAEQAIKLCSGVRGLGNCKFGDYCLASDDVQLSGDNNILGDHFVAGQGFKMIGLDNTIGRNAKVGEFGLLCNTIISDSFEMNDFGEIHSCNISTSSESASSSYRLKNCKISGTSIKSTVLGMNGSLNKCSIDKHVFTSQGTEYQDCFFRAVDSIAKNSILINPKFSPPKGHKIIINEGVKIKGGRVKNACFKGEKKGRIIVSNTHIQYSQLHNTTVNGEHSVLQNSYLYDGTKISGIGDFGTDNRIDGRVSLQGVKIHNHPSDIYTNQSIVTMKNIEFALPDNSICFHNTNNKAAKINLKDSDISAFEEISCNDKSFKSNNCKINQSKSMAPPTQSENYGDLDRMVDEELVNHDGFNDADVAAAYNDYHASMVPEQTQHKSVQAKEVVSRKSVLPKANIILPFDQQQPQGMTFSFNDEKVVMSKKIESDAQIDVSPEESSEMKMGSTL